MYCRKNTQEKLLPFPTFRTILREAIHSPKEKIEPRTDLISNTIRRGKNILIVSAGFLIVSADAIRLSADTLIVFFSFSFVEISR